MTCDRETKKAFSDYMLTGGEACLGGGIKNCAGREKKRLEAKLETPNLFPHIEHEDRTELDKQQRYIELGQKMVDNYRSRKKSLGALLKPSEDADLPAEDLEPKQ